jgi:hypothetical protein
MSEEIDLKEILGAFRDKLLIEPPFKDVKGKNARAKK